MVTTNLYRKINIATRVLTGLIAGASLTLYVIIFFKINDYRFPSENMGYSILAIIALSIAILWNLLAIILTALNLQTLRGFFHPVGDTLALLLLISLGTTGFVHDNNAYLRNGLWAQYDNSLWLKQAIWAGALMLVTAIFQIFIILLAFFRPSPSKVQSERLDTTHQPPAYDEGEFGYGKDVKENDWKSEISVEVPSSVYKKGDSNLANEEEREAGFVREKGRWAIE